jgi:hypothetical protein
MMTKIIKIILWVILISMTFIYVNVIEYLSDIGKWLYIIFISINVIALLAIHDEERRSI